MSTDHFPSVDGSFLHPVTVNFSSTLWIPVLRETPPEGLSCCLPCVLHTSHFKVTSPDSISWSIYTHPFLHRGLHSLPQCLLFLINGHLLNKILIHHLLVCHALPLFLCAPLSLPVLLFINEALVSYCSENHPGSLLYIYIFPDLIPRKCQFN